jgi:predicted nucleic acid-binding protein
VILVDSSVWIDHLRRGNPSLREHLELGLVLTHPWVIGELAWGNLAHRQTVLRLLDQLPKCIVADEREVSDFIEAHRLHGKGLRYVDVNLLASTLLTPDARLLTLDRRLHAAATTFGLDAKMPSAPDHPGILR